MREAVTTWLELVGLLLLAAAGGVYVAGFTLAGGLGTSGVLVIGGSLLVSTRGPRARASDGESTA